LEVSELVLNEVWANILSTYNDGGNISGKLAEYTKESKNHQHHIDALINIYKREMEKLCHNITKTALSDKQKNTVKLEMKVLEDICDTNIRGSSVHDTSSTIGATLFKDILEAVCEKCPLSWKSM
jgi:DNA-binding ferritin-like protein (Dps family)